MGHGDAAVVNPCEQKDNIETLYKMANENKDKLHNIEVKQAQIAGDVSHIKSRLDNGMSHSIANINKIVTALEPVIAYHAEFIKKAEAEDLIAKNKHHARIVGKIEDIGWWISKIVLFALMVALAGVIVWATANGWKP